jgi:hypothetical protein
MFRPFERWPRFLNRSRLADLVLTVLVLNLISTLIQGRLEFSILGWRDRTPTWGLSALLVVAWVGGRVALRHRDRIDPRIAGDWMRAHVPEILLAALFAVGLTIRLSGNDFGSPLIVHPDEHQVAGVAIRMLKSGWIDPPTPYHYPTVFHYLLLPAFGLAYVRGKSAGEWATLDEVSERSFQFYELARTHSGILGALTILLTYALARRMWPEARGRWVGVVAAAVLTFSFNHVKESHYGVTDAALTFFIVLAFIAIVRAYRRGTIAAYALAGFACGIACATKYSALPVVFVLIAAHLLGGSSALTAWRRLAVGLVAVPVGFFTGYPYALLNWPPFLEHLGWMSAYSGSRQFSPTGRFMYVLRYSMDSGFGVPFALALAAALLLAIHRRRPLELLIVTFTVGVLVLLCNTAFPFYPRYLVPLVPFAALLVGSFVIEGAEWLQRQPRVAALTPVAAVAVVAALTWPQAQESIGFVNYVTSPDTRAQAYEYIIQNLPAGSVVASEDRYLRLPRGYRLLRWTPLQSRTPEQFVEAGVDALVFSGEREPRAPGKQRLDLRKRFPPQVEFSDDDGTAVGPSVAIHLVRNE